MPPPPGDVDNNGTVDFNDLPAFITEYRSARNTGRPPKPAADLNGDQRCDTVDARLFLELLLPPPSTATVSLSPATFSGPGTMTISVTDQDYKGLPSVVVLVSSRNGDPQGELVRLLPTSQPGTFKATVALARIYSEVEYLPPEEGDGKIGVYADAGLVRDTVTVSYADGRRPSGAPAIVTATATYEEPPSTVTGVVKDPTGRPVGGAALRLLGRNGFDARAVSRSQAGREGHYAFYGLATDKYTLVTAITGYSPTTRTFWLKVPGSPAAGILYFDKSVYLGPDDAATITVEDPDLAGQQEITVVVRSQRTDPTGESVKLQATGDGLTFRGTVRWQRPFNEQGPVDVPAGDGRVGVYAEGNVARETVIVTYRDTQRPSWAPQDVRATAAYEEPPSTVTGVVRDPSGTPIAGAAIRIVGNNVDRQTTSRSPAPYTGHFSFYALPAGSYTVTVAAGSYLRQTFQVTVPAP